MKTAVNVTTCLFLIFAFTTVHAQSWWGSGKKVTGSGKVSTKTHTTGDYDYIHVAGSMDVHLEKGKEGSITVTTDDNLHDLFEIRTEGRKLIIKTKKGVYYKSKKGVHITVPFQDLAGVSLSGSGDIDSKDLIKADKFRTSVTGSGDVQLPLDARTTEVSVTGSGDLTLEGSTSELEVDVTGSGNFHGFNFNSESVDASVTGSGDADIVAHNDLKARVSGSGDICYKGNPKNKDLKTSGSGDISGKVSMK